MRKRDEKRNHGLLYYRVRVRESEPQRIGQRLKAAQTQLELAQHAMRVRRGILVSVMNDLHLRSFYVARRNILSVILRLCRKSHVSFWTQARELFAQRPELRPALCHPKPLVIDGLPFDKPDYFYVQNGVTWIYYVDGGVCVNVDVTRHELSQCGIEELR